MAEPGQGVNNPEGFVDLTDPMNIVTINIPSLSGTASIPLSVLPFWRNDGGVRSYGGAKYISVFEDGASEGTTTAKVVAINQQPIESTGTFELPNPDAQHLYNVRIRLRSAQSDPNYKDYVIAFRVVTPLEVPIEFATFDDPLPDIVNTGSDFAFSATPPNTEIRLRTDGEGILLPTSTANFSAEAAAYLLSQLDKQRNGMIGVDFLKNGTVEATARQWYFFRWTGSVYDFIAVRRQDFPGWDQYSGSDLGIAQATIKQGIENPVMFTGPTGIAQILETATPRAMTGIEWDSRNKVMYGCSASGGKNVFAIDATTGAAVRIGTPATLNGDPSGLAYDPVRDIMYGSTDATSGAMLFTVDRLANEWTDTGIASIGEVVRDIAYDTELDRLLVLADNGPNSQIRVYIPGDTLTLEVVRFVSRRLMALTAREDFANSWFAVDDSSPQDMYRVIKLSGSTIMLDAYDALSDVVSLAYDINLDRMYSTLSTTADPNFHYSEWNPGAAAYLEFTHNLYTTGPRFESLIAVGKKGMKSINPKATIVGGKIPITSIVEFGYTKFLQRLGHEDQYVLLCGVTDTQIIVRQVPLWDQLISPYSIGGQRAIADLDAPPTFLLNSRLLTWPFIEFPNYLSFYDPAPAAIQLYPNLANIKLIDQSGATVATWTDEADLWGDLVSARFPDAGVSFPCLDVRSLLSSSDSFYQIEADVIVDASGTNDYTATMTYPLNVDGEPLMWERPDLDVVEEMPIFGFSEWGKLDITTPAVWNGGAFTLLGDVAGTVGIIPQPAGTTQTYDMTELMTRHSDYVTVSWVNGVNSISLNVPTTVEKTQLEGSDTIDAFLDGNTIMFPVGSLTEVQASSGQKDVVLVGDVGSIPLYNISEGVIYRLGLFGKGSQLFASPNTPYVDIHFDGVTDKSAVRIANTFYSFKEAQQQNTTLAIANRGGPSSNGLASAAYAFSMPRMRFDAAMNEIEFEDDGSLYTFNTSKFIFWNPVTMAKREINGSILTGTTYQLGVAGRSLSVDDHIVVSAAHVNGQVTTVAYKLTEGFSNPLKLTPEGYL